MTSHLRQLVLLLLVISQLLIATGVPLPTHVSQVVAGKDDTEWFACLNKPCGCMSAEQCRTSCCCRPEPKRDTKSRKTRSSVAMESSGKGCCATEETPACATDDAAAICGTLSDKPPTEAKTQQGEPRAPRPASGRIVLGAAAAQCQGLGTSAYFTQVLTLPLLATPQLESPLSLVATNQLDDDHPVAVAYQPELPPPRS